MSWCLKWVAVKDGGLILCGVRAVPKISPFRQVLNQKSDKIKNKSKKTEISDPSLLSALLGLWNLSRGFRFYLNHGL